MAPKLSTNTRAVASGLVALALFLSQPRTLLTVQAQAPDELSYTTAQAERGRSVYAEQCASCHGQNLDDGAFAPSLTGLEFRTKWGQQSAEPLFTYTATRMPPNQPGSLGDARYTDLMAFILQQNGSPTGSRELLTDAESLRTMPAPRWPRPMGGGVTRGLSLPPPPPRPNPLDRITPVTDAMLVRPPEGEWLSWRRTYDAYGFSPLKKINRSNVKDLRVAWSWALPNGVNQTAPLVHDGVMFVYGNGDKVQAFDAARGDLLWQYDRRLPTGVAPSSKRGMSIYGRRLDVPTSDAHIVALDVKPGKPVWDSPVADAKGGYGITGGTLVARGKVMVGTTGRAPGGNYIVALDAETGKEAWRVSTIARPGEPGGNTSNDIPLETRSGRRHDQTGDCDDGEADDLRLRGRRNRTLSDVGRYRSRSGSAERGHRDRPEDRHQDRGSKPRARRRHDQDGLPARRRRPRLDADVVRRLDEDRVRAVGRGLHGHEPCGQRRARHADHRRALDDASPGRHRRQVRTARGDQSRNEKNRLGRAPARAVVVGRARDGRRPGVRRRPRPHVQRARCPNRRTPVAGAPERRARIRADELCGRRPGVRRRHRRRRRSAHAVLQSARPGVGVRGAGQIAPGCWF